MRTMPVLVMLLVLASGTATAQTAAAPAISQQNMQALTEILSSPAAQSLIATQLGTTGGNTPEQLQTHVSKPMIMLGSEYMGSMASILQNFTPAEIAAMQRFALSPEGQSIAQKLPAVIQQLQAQGAVPAAGQ